MTANVENIRKWVEALRSGKYAQGYGQLRDRDGFCCLGVACEVSGLPYGPNETHWPRHVQEFYGIDDPSPEIGSQSLVDWNDAEQVGFHTIADLIEGEWLTGVEATR